MPHCFKSLFIYVLFVSHAALAGDIKEPKLLSDSSYSEYWEQQFLFENKTLATSQFLITNLPFSKHHGIMVGTLKEPSKDSIIIKNGRKKTGWFYSTEPAETMSIFQHKLIADEKGYLMQLHNTAAEVDVLFTKDYQAINLIPKNEAENLPQVTLYAPAAQAYGRWRAGPEIGGAGENGNWLDLGWGFGYGLHVVHTETPNKQLKKWIRFSGLTENKEAAPILHIFETPSGRQIRSLTLMQKTGKPTTFENITFKPITPMSWQITGISGDSTMKGEIAISEPLDVFNLKDQLNAIEKLAAGSMADVERHKYLTTYQFTLTTGESVKAFTGNALMENIIFGKEQKKRPRRRR
ncbi:hypothetical protein [Kordiimonas laminariae]|uniref:hypothetical protein n=1 Tax=Kordiimonas laminariae TaxID=2917717 RepID=UPI001FF5AFE4|nr:hypothetical protein [Kordiimonas laminariae]MCK0070834.1 hypothetical protein [Kordiimonas laminariae]